MDVLEPLEVTTLAGPCVIRVLFGEGIDILRGYKERFTATLGIFRKLEKVPRQH